MTRDETSSCSRWATYTLAILIWKQSFAQAAVSLRRRSTTSGLQPGSVRCISMSPCVDIVSSRGGGSRARRLSPLNWRRVIAVAVCASLLLPTTTAVSSRNVVVLCNGGYKGMESGTIVATMPPDTPVPTGEVNRCCNRHRHTTSRSPVSPRLFLTMPRSRSRHAALRRCRAGGYLQPALALILGDTEGELVTLLSLSRVEMPT